MRIRCFPRRPRVRSLTHWVSVAMVAMVAMLVLAGGPTGTTGQPANAAGPVAMFPDFCPGFLKAEDAPNAAGYRSGVEQLFGLLSPVGKVVVPSGTVGGPWGNRPTTGYELFQSGGLFWSRYDTSCGSVFVGGFQNLVANQIFGYSKVMTTMIVGIYGWAADPDFLDAFLEPIGCIVEGCAGKGSGLDDVLYLNFLAPVVVLGALWLGWVGLVKKSSTQAWQGALWMLGSATFALAFMADPTGAAKLGNNAVSETNNMILESLTSATAGAEPDELCYLPGGGEDFGVRSSSCEIWKTLAYTPWVVGQFNMADTSNLSNPGTPVKIGNRVSNDIAVSHLWSQSITHEDAAKYGTSAGAEVICNHIDDGKPCGKKQNWEKIAEKMGEGTSWAGADAGFRVNLAFSAMVANLAAGAVILVVSIATVVLAIAMLLLIMVAPIFLLVGVHPGMGRGVALKWLELLLGTVVKRIILGFMLAILIGFYQIIISMDTPVFPKIALLMAVGIASILYRKPLMETFNVVQLGGTNSGLERGGERVPGQTGGAATGAGVGAVTAAAAGGGAGAIVGGLVSGGMTGRMSGSPTQAARVGVNEGKRKASAAKNRRRQQQIEEEKVRQTAADEAERRKKEAEGDDGDEGGGDGGEAPRPDKDTDGGPRTGGGGGNKVPTGDGPVPAGQKPVPRPQTNPRPAPQTNPVPEGTVPKPEQKPVPRPEKRSGPTAIGGPQPGPQDSGRPKQDRGAVPPPRPQTTRPRPSPQPKGPSTGGTLPPSGLPTGPAAPSTSERNPRPRRGPAGQ